MSAPSSHCDCRGRSCGRSALRHNWPRRAGDVLLFDEKLAWEKPCGGGVTHKALQQYPFLAEAGNESSRIEQNSIEQNPPDYNLPALNLVDHCELISPAGKRVRFRLQHPVAIFSRLALNGLLLERARRASADIHTGAHHAHRTSRQPKRRRLATDHARAANTGRPT